MSHRQADRPGVIAPPPFIYLAGLGAGYGLHRWKPLPLDLFSGQRTAGGIVTILAVLLFLWCLLQFRKHGTSVDPRHPSTAIVASGPYRFSRNPIYLAFTFMYLGAVLRLGNTWMLAALLPALLVIEFGVVRREERYLKEKFPDAYGRYVEKVRRWF